MKRAWRRQRGRNTTTPGNVVWADGKETFREVEDENATAARTLLYTDRNVGTTYDLNGRMTRTDSTRYWGAALAALAGGQKYEQNYDGGGVQGLSEDWTSGQAQMTTTYGYDAGSGLLSSMKVTADGTGVHANGEVQAMGIHLTYHQSAIKYDSLGRITSYHQSVTQVEKYDYVKQVQKGLKRKNAKKSATESVTTESDVQVLEYDGFGRQVHTITTSQRNDRNKVWTQTDARVKSFDDHGRALEVERFTQSKATVEKKKGSLGMQVLSIAVIAINPVVGLAMLSSTSLGGQNIHSFSHTVAVNQYKADGTLDEEATKAHTTTLEEYSYQQGQNFGDKTMQAVDISVAVALVVATVVSFGAATPLAVFGFAVLFAGAGVAYQGARQGISINDFEAHPDREQAHQSRMMVAQFGATVATAGVASWASQTSAVVQLTGMVTQVGVAAAGGAHGKTLWTVAAVSAVNGLMGGYGLSGGGNALRAGVGELVRQTGMTYGKSSQRTTWMLAGTAIGASGDTGQMATSVGKSLALGLYAKKNDGSGGTDQERYQQGFVVSAMGEALGTALGLGTKLYEERAFEQKASALGKTPAEYREYLSSLPQPKKDLTFTGFMSDLGAGLMSPLKALAGWMGLPGSGAKGPAETGNKILSPGEPSVGAENSATNAPTPAIPGVGAEPKGTPTGAMPRLGTPNLLPRGAVEGTPEGEPLGEGTRKAPRLTPTLDLFPFPIIRFPSMRLGPLGMKPTRSRETNLGEEPLMATGPNLFGPAELAETAYALFLSPVHRDVGGLMFSWTDLSGGATDPIAPSAMGQVLEAGRASVRNLGARRAAKEESRTKAVRQEFDKRTSEELAVVIERKREASRTAAEFLRSVVGQSGNPFVSHWGKGQVLEIAGAKDREENLMAVRRLIGNGRWEEASVLEQSGAESYHTAQKEALTEKLGAINYWVNEEKVKARDSETLAMLGSMAVSIEKAKAALARDEVATKREGDVKALVAGILTAYRSKDMQKASAVIGTYLAPEYNAKQTPLGKSLSLVSGAWGKVKMLNPMDPGGLVSAFTSKLAENRQERRDYMALRLGELNEASEVLASTSRTLGREKGDSALVRGRAGLAAVEYLTRGAGLSRASSLFKARAKEGMPLALVGKQRVAETQFKRREALGVLTSMARGDGEANPKEMEKAVQRMELFTLYGNDLGTAAGLMTEREAMRYDIGANIGACLMPKTTRSVGQGTDALLKSVLVRGEIGNGGLLNAMEEAYSIRSDLGWHTIITTANALMWTASGVQAVRGGWLAASRLATLRGAPLTKIERVVATFKLAGRTGLLKGTEKMAFGPKWGVAAWNETVSLMATPGATAIKYLVGGGIMTGIRAGQTGLKERRLLTMGEAWDSFGEGVLITGPFGVLAAPVEAIPGLSTLTGKGAAARGWMSTEALAGGVTARGLSLTDRIWAAGVTGMSTGENLLGMWAVQSVTKETVNGLGSVMYGDVTTEGMRVAVADQVGGAVGLTKMFKGITLADVWETEILRSAQAEKSAFPLPRDGILLTASKAPYARAAAQGKGYGNPAGEGVWVTVPEAYRGVKTSLDVARNGALFEVGGNGHLLLDPARGEKIVMIRVVDPTGVEWRVPLDRAPLDPGVLPNGSNGTNNGRGRSYVEGNQTSGGSPEWLVRRIEIKDGAYEVLGEFDPSEVGGARWNKALADGKKAGGSGFKGPGFESTVSAPIVSVKDVPAAAEAARRVAEKGGSVKLNVTPEAGELLLKEFGTMADARAVKAWHEGNAEVLLAGKEAAEVQLKLANAETDSLKLKRKGVETSKGMHEVELKKAKLEQIAAAEDAKIKRAEADALKQKIDGVNDGTARQTVRPQAGNTEGGAAPRLEEVTGSKDSRIFIDGDGTAKTGSGGPVEGLRADQGQAERSKLGQAEDGRPAVKRGHSGPENLGPKDIERLRTDGAGGGGIESAIRKRSARVGKAEARVGQTTRRVSELEGIIYGETSQVKSLTERIDGFESEGRRLASEVSLLDGGRLRHLGGAADAEALMKSWAGDPARQGGRGVDLKIRFDAAERAILPGTVVESGLLRVAERLSGRNLGTGAVHSKAKVAPGVEVEVVESAPGTKTDPGTREPGHGYRFEFNQEGWVVTDLQQGANGQKVWTTLDGMGIGSRAGPGRVRVGTADEALALAQAHWNVNRRGEPPLVWDVKAFESARIEAEARGVSPETRRWALWGAGQINWVWEVFQDSFDNAFDTGGRSGASALSRDKWAWQKSLVAVGALAVVVSGASASTLPTTSGTGGPAPMITPALEGRPSVHSAHDPAQPVVVPLGQAVESKDWWSETTHAVSHTLTATKDRVVANAKVVQNKAARLYQSTKDTVAEVADRTMDVTHQWAVATVQTAQKVKEATVDTTQKAMAWTARVSRSAEENAKAYVLGYPDDAKMVVGYIGEKSSVAYGLALLKYGARVKEDPIPGYEKIASPLSTKVLADQDGMSFYSVQKGTPHKIQPVAVFEMRHSYRVVPGLGMTSFSPPIRLEKGENASQVSLMFNTAPGEIEAELKTSKTIDLFIHGYNVPSENSLNMGMNFAKGLLSNQYKNPGLMVSWSGDLGSNRFSKLALFRRAEHSADISWQGLQRLESFVKVYNPDIKINAVTHSLGAHLLLEAAANGVKFNNVVLFVPAVDNEDISVGGKYEKAIQNIDHLTIVYSERQEVVFGLSYRLTQWDRALGYTGPSGLVRHPDFKAINATDARRNPYGIEINSHSDIYEPEAVEMLYRQWRLGQKR
ncbi:MAG: alpha/beta hydrolase [Elusimicrobia bacterium]|nr:alpha/beta hydrolase [Elusimicrobiota bacterium]